MTPFPWTAMMAISAAFLSHVFCLSGLYPYVGYMVQHIGAAEDKDRAGFYTGFVVSAFMVGRFLSSYYWGRFADEHGRLPVLYISLSTMAVISIAFGMSTSLLWAVTCRFILGATNAILSTSKTMIADICGPEHEMTGMSFLTATLSVGFMIGTWSGGWLAEPATYFPEYFSETGIFGRFPYLLPNLFVASTAVLAMCAIYFLLDETHRPRDSQEVASVETKGGFREQFVRPWQMLSERRIRDVMFIHVVFTSIQSGLPQVFPLWALSTTASGGLNWPSHMIGQVLSMVGFCTIFFQLFIYPSILKHMGINTTQKWASLIQLLFYPSVPMLSILRGHKGVLMISTSANYFLLFSCTSAVFINMSLTINNLVDSRRRGEINGLSMMAESLGKAIGPFIFSVAFAWSISCDRPFPLGAHLVFIMMSMCSGIGAFCGWNIIGRDIDKEANADEDKEAALAVTPKGSTERTKLVQPSPVYTTGEPQDDAEKVKLVGSSLDQHLG